MALIKFGGGVSGASGKIAGQVFSRNRSGNYIRNWNKPVNAQTPAQQNVRQILGDSNAAWSLLTPPQVNAWRAYAALSVRRNRLGEEYTPTAKQVFTEAYINMTTVGLAPLTTPPPIIYVSPAMTSLTIGLAEVSADEMASLEVSVNGATIPSGGDPADSKVIIYGAPNVPYQRNFVKNLYRVIVIEDATISSVDIRSLYNAVFGNSSSVGAALHLAARIVDAGTGLASPLYTVRAVTTAA